MAPVSCRLVAPSARASADELVASRTVAQAVMISGLIRTALPSFSHVEIKHVEREQNHRADYLANLL